MERWSTAGWVRATATVTLTALAIGLGLWALWRAHLALMLTVLSLLVAVALDHPVSWLAARRVPRGLAIAGLTVALLLVLVALGVVFVPPLLEQVQLLVDGAPGLAHAVEQSAAFRFAARYVDLSTVVEALQQRGPALASAVVGGAVQAVTLVAGGIAGLVTILFVVVFMLASGRPLVRAALARARPDRRPIYEDVLAQTYHSLGGYIGGLFVLVLSNAIFSGVFLAAIGVRYFLPLAVFAGLSSLIPYAGTIAAGAVLSLVAWASGGPWLALATVAYYVTYQQVESHLIAPMVYKRTVDLNPLVMLLAALFLADLDGIPGAMIAVPLAATVQIVLRELFRLRRGAAVGSVAGPSGSGPSHEAGALGAGAVPPRRIAPPRGPGPPPGPRPER